MGQPGVPEGLITLNARETLRSVEAVGKAAAEFKSTPRYIPSHFSSDSKKMKKSVTVAKCVLILCIILIITSTSVMAEWYYDADSVTVDLNIRSGLDITTQPGYSLDYVTADVLFIPQDTDSQSVIRISADPEPEYQTPGEYRFRWEKPIPANPSFDIAARVKTKNTFHKIRKMPFPYEGYPDNVEHYTDPADTVDSDHPKIIEKASELAAGESDYYAVVFRMADYVKENVDYDLSTLNIKASKKASFVLARKDGVCDEITTLFMALLRAVGIPTRFVSGIAYTESPQFPQNWGAHGWAEVYFPGTGWVPFDVTYGQYGFVDPSHVKLKDSFDSAESDTRYEWLGRNVNVVANPITVTADLFQHTGKVPDHFDIDVSMLQDTVGIGSYNLVEATVTNNKDSYASGFLYLSKINELEIDGNNYRSIMLGPKETRSFYWIVKVIDSLDSHYTYTFPMTVANMRNTSAETEFYVTPGATRFSKQDMERVVDAAEKEADKIYSKKVEIDCTQHQEYYYTYDDPMITCAARNTGNFPFKNLEFCFEDECHTADLAIAQEKAFDYTHHYSEPGINKLQFTVEGKDVSKSFFYDLDVLDAPEVSIDDLEYPSQIEFQKPYTLAFTLKKTSSSTPQDVFLEMDAAGLEKEIDVGEMKADKKFLFNMDSGDLSTKPNIFTIAATYTDLNGKVYTQKEEFEISLINVTFGQKMIIFVHDLDRWLRNLFK